MTRYSGKFAAAWPPSPSLRRSFLVLLQWGWIEEHQARMGAVFILPAVLFLLVFVIYPVFDVLRLSVFVVDFVTNQEKFVGLANFVQILRDPKLANVAWNTLIWTVFSLAGQFGPSCAFESHVRRR